VAVIASDGEHVRLRLAGGNLVEDLQGFGIDHSDCIFELGGYVKQVILWSELGTMGSNAFAEIDGADDLAGGKVDNSKERTISAGVAYSGVAVDGDERAFAVGRGNDLVARDTVFRDGSDLLSSDGIDDAEGLVAFIGDEQKAMSIVLGGGQKQGRAQEEKQMDEISSEAHNRSIVRKGMDVNGLRNSEEG
jgi:hypothetical protein